MTVHRGWLLLIVVATLRPCTAEDRVVLQLPGSIARTHLRGEIVEYTGKSISVRAKQTQRTRTYPADHVVEVQTPQTEEHVEGLLHFRNGRIADAEAKLTEAMSVEARVWVRREILGWLVRCSLRKNDKLAAGSRFLSLVKSDPTTPHFSLVPLAWASSALNPTVQRELRQWLTGATDVERLIGASHLLLTGDDSEIARQELQALSSSTNIDVRLLARSQLWRIRVAEGTITESELRRWENRIEQLPQSLRGGPYFVLGQGHRQRREFDRAAAAFLWLPLVHHHDHLLAARATFEAAESLERIGQRPAAARLYYEVTTRFRSTSFAAEAKAARSQLLSPQGSPTTDSGE